MIATSLHRILVLIYQFLLALLTWYAYSPALATVVLTSSPQVVLALLANPVPSYLLAFMANYASLVGSAAVIGICQFFDMPLL